MTAHERVQSALRELGLNRAIVEFQASTHTVEAAAQAIGCERGQIVKTLFFLADGRPTLVLVAGDMQVDTAELARLLGVGRKKLRMGTPDEVLEATGFALGGVAPIGSRTACDVVIDGSLLRFERVWAAAGTANAVFSVEMDALVTATRGQLANVTHSLQAATA